MIGKVVGSAISLILVVGVIIGVVVVVNRGGSGNDDNLSPQMKLVSQFCQNTDHKGECMESLGSINNTSDPRAFIEAAILATSNAVKKSFNQSESLIAQVNNGTRTRMALEDCQNMLQFAIDELQDSLDRIGDTQIQSIIDQVPDLQNWFSAVVTYQQTCLDGLDNNTDATIGKAVNEGMDSAAKLTSNALAIVADMSKILESFGLKLNIPSANSTSRRLLEAGADGFPSWLSAADRKLLGVQYGKVKPDAVVAQDGSGQYKTIAAALNAYPKNHKGRYSIYVKAGIYNEYITVGKNQVNVFMYGDGPRKTIVTGKKSYASGVGTMKTASFSVVGAGFICNNMGFQNTAGPDGHQAVALRVQADKAAFYNCRMDAYQDTLYVHAHRQFYRNCVISGTVDFIFGDAAVIIQNCLIIVRKPGPGQQNMVTAQGRKDKFATTGIVIHNCRIVPEEKLFPVRFQFPTYLGRPWKEYSRTVYMESTLGDLIQPVGWYPWAGDFGLNTLYYAEYANRGPGAVTAKRVNWKGYRGVISKQEAAQFTAGPFIQGATWLQLTGAKYMLGFRR